MTSAYASQQAKRLNASEIVITGFMAAFPRARAVMFHNDSRCLRNEICRTWPPTAKKSDTRHKIGKTWNQSAQQTQLRPSNPMHGWYNRITGATASTARAAPVRAGLKGRPDHGRDFCRSCRAASWRLHEVSARQAAVVVRLVSLGRQADGGSARPLGCNRH
jgi:hypothetical protein